MSHNTSPSKRLTLVLATPLADLELGRWHLVAACTPCRRTLIRIPTETLPAGLTIGSALNRLVCRECGRRPRLVALEGPQGFAMVVRGVVWV